MVDDVDNHQNYCRDTQEPADYVPHNNPPILLSFILNLTIWHIKCRRRMALDH